MTPANPTESTEELKRRSMPWIASTLAVYLTILCFSIGHLFLGLGNPDPLLAFVEVIGMGAVARTWSWYVRRRIEQIEHDIEIDNLFGDRN